MDSKYKQRLVRLLELLKEAPPAQDDEFADEEPADVLPPVKKKVAVPGNAASANVPRNAPVNKAPANVPPANAAPTNAPANVPANAPTNVPANAAPANAPANAPTNAPVNAQPKIPANMASNAAPSTNVPTNAPAANVPVAIPGMDNDVPANANAVAADAEEKVRQGKVNLFFDKLAENPNLMSFLQLTNPLEQAAAIERFAELVGIPQGQLVNVLSSLRQKAATPTPEPAMESKTARVEAKVRRLIGMLKENRDTNWAVKNIEGFIADNEGVDGFGDEAGGYKPSMKLFGPKQSKNFDVTFKELKAIAKLLKRMHVPETTNPTESRLREGVPGSKKMTLGQLFNSKDKGLGMVYVGDVNDEAIVLDVVPADDTDTSWLSSGNNATVLTKYLESERFHDQIIDKYNRKTKKRVSYIDDIYSTIQSLKQYSK